MQYSNYHRFTHKLICLQVDVDNDTLIVLVWTWKVVALMVLLLNTFFIIKNNYYFPFESNSIYLFLKYIICGKNVVLFRYESIFLYGKGKHAKEKVMQMWRTWDNCYRPLTLISNRTTSVWMQSSAIASCFFSEMWLVDLIDRLVSKQVFTKVVNAFGVPPGINPF